MKYVRVALPKALDEFIILPQHPYAASDPTLPIAVVLNLSVMLNLNLPESGYYTRWQ